MTDIRRGATVRHKVHGWTGEVIAVAGPPLLRWMRRRLTVCFDLGGIKLTRHGVIEDDIEIVGAPAASAVPFTIADEPMLDFSKVSCAPRATSARRPTLTVVGGGDAA